MTAAVLLNYNSSANLQVCVSTLLQQSVVPRIYIVDNASSPDDAARARKIAADANATFIASPTNVGYNAGNNLGLKAALADGCEFALIANPDMIFNEPDHLALLEESMRLDPQIAVVAGDVTQVDGTHINPRKTDRTWRETFWWVRGIISAFYPMRRKNTPPYGESRYCKIVGGSCMMVRLSDIRDIGWLDEGVFLYCEEDILSYQLEYFGKRVYYNAEARALHAHRRQEKRDMLQRIPCLRVSRYYFIDNYCEDGPIGKCICKLSASLYTFLLKLNMRLHRTQK